MPRQNLVHLVIKCKWTNPGILKANKLPPVKIRQFDKAVDTNKYLRPSESIQLILNNNITNITKT